MLKKDSKSKNREFEPYIREEDIVEKFIKAGGPGGQFVNKTSSCVYLKHIPTGIEVKCQEARSQAMNRHLAREILAGKVRVYQLKQIRAKISEAEKLKRQFRKKPARLKKKILEEKRRLSEKKRLRSKKVDLY
ncbi:MAG: peptide chain release factor-like protein [Candidatus Omnitrophica bacterium]|nr:peptide chain release factor-like protein [Candidatus Omnitrophota bacterium]